MRYVLNREYELLTILDNDSEHGIAYYGDELNISDEDGFYTGRFFVEKVRPDLGLEQGNFVTFKNRRGEQLLMTIMESEEDDKVIEVVLEDIGLDLINGYLDEEEAPINPKNIKYYLEKALHGTGWEIGEIDTVNAHILEFTEQQSILERVQSIVNSFGARARYTVDFNGFKVEKLKINILSNDGKPKALRLDTDINIDSVTRRQSMYDFATRVTVRGGERQTEEVIDRPGDITGIPEPEGEAWAPEIIDRRATSMGGQSNDRPQSDVTHVAIHYTAVDRMLNRTIESHERYWRDTHGWDRGGYHYYINAQGVLFWNYNYERITYGVGGNNSYTVHVSVEANSAENYSEAQLKTRDWIVRKMMKDLSIPAKNVWQHNEFPGNSGTLCAGYTKSQMDAIRTALANTVNYDYSTPTPEVTTYDTMIEKAIEIAYSLIGVPYAWGGNTKSGFDCSGLVNICYKEAGFTNWVPYRATTYTYWSQAGPFKRVPNAERKRGDLVLMDTSGTPPGHVGIYIGDNMMLHTGGPNGVAMKNAVSLSGYRVMGYVRVQQP